MSKLSFTKLASSITDSSVWQHSSDIRIVWVTLLAMADPLGRIHAAVPGLARRANVSREATEEALEVFLAPDLDSRSKDHDGRRIEEIDGGWRLLNYRAYRELQDEEARLASKIANQTKSRERHDLGYIYYAQNRDHLKIGYSKNPWSRISELRCACPTLELVGLEKGTMQDEKERHERFSHLHHDRDWFMLKDELLEYITKIPMLDKLSYGRYRNQPPNPVVQSVVNYDKLRLTMKTQEEVEGEGEVEEKVEGDKSITPSMVSTAVLQELRLSDRYLAIALDGVCHHEMKGGRGATELRDSMIAAYQDYEKAKPSLTYTKGATKFFGEGDWRNKAGWPWKEGKQPTHSGAKVLTLTEKVLQQREAR